MKNSVINAVIGTMCSITMLVFAFQSKLLLFKDVFVNHTQNSKTFISRIRVISNNTENHFQA